MQQLVKFGIVGLIAFLIDYSLLAFCAEILQINYLVSATIGFTVSVVFNYFASMRYVFRRKEGMSRNREFIIFIMLSVIGLGINNALMWSGVELLGVHYLIVKLFATAVVALWNFITKKAFLDARMQASGTAFHPLLQGNPALGRVIPTTTRTRTRYPGAKPRGCDNNDFRFDTNSD